MSTHENRVKALEIAAGLNSISGGTSDWQRDASVVLTFLEFGSFAVGTETAVPEGTPPAADLKNPDPPPAAPAPRKPRAARAAPSTPTAAPAPESAPAPATAAPVATATSPSEEKAKLTKLTLDDVRAALVACQTRKGDKNVPSAILKKYAPTGTTGTLPEDKYATVISECAAA